MNFYSIIFERIWAVFHKGASVDPADEKFDGAVLSSMLLTVPVMINILTIAHLVRVYCIIDLIKGGKVYYIGLGFFLMAFNAFYFLRKKRYLKLSSSFAELPKSKKIIYTIASWTYVIGSIVLFFLILSVGRE